MSEATNKKVMVRIRRVAGQLDGVSRMIEGDRSSVEVIIQLASAQAALVQADKVVLRAFVETRLVGVDVAVAPGERKQRIHELMDVFARYGGLERRLYDAG